MEDRKRRKGKMKGGVGRGDEPQETVDSVCLLRTLEGSGVMGCVGQAMGIKEGRFGMEHWEL